MQLSPQTMKSLIGCCMTLKAASHLTEHQNTGRLHQLLAPGGGSQGVLRKKRNINLPGTFA